MRKVATSCLSMACGMFQRGNPYLSWDRFQGEVKAERLEMNLTFDFRLSGLEYGLSQ